MAYPEDPRRFVVLDRVITVLKLIRAGDDYFYTPYEVTKRFIHWAEIKGSPTYMVHLASGGVLTHQMDHTSDETFYLSVKGIVQGFDDIPEKIIKSNRDIRNAINADSLNRDDGLGSMSCVVQVLIDEPPETDNGYLALEGYGFFDQLVRCHITGEIGEL